MSNGTGTPTAVVILAAGQGTRMKSDTPKMLHGIGGRTMLEHALYAAHGVDPQEIVAVVGHQRDKVTRAIAEWVGDQVEGSLPHGVASPTRRSRTAPAMRSSAHSTTPRCRSSRAPCW